MICKFPNGPIMSNCGILLPEAYSVELFQIPDQMLYSIRLAIRIKSTRYIQDSPDSRALATRDPWLNS